MKKMSKSNGSLRKLSGRNQVKSIQINLSEQQALILELVVRTGKVSPDDVDKPLDKRTINSLAAKGYIKVKEAKKGMFLTPTASGKKVFEGFAA